MHNGIKDFWEADASAFREPFFDKFPADKIVKGEVAGKFDDVFELKFFEPVAVVLDFNFREIKKLLGLFLVGFEVVFDLLFC